MDAYGPILSTQQVPLSLFFRRNVVRGRPMKIGRLQEMSLMLGQILLI